MPASTCYRRNSLVNSLAEYRSIVKEARLLLRASSIGSNSRPSSSPLSTSMQHQQQQQHGKQSTEASFGGSGHEILSPTVMNSSHALASTNENRGCAGDHGKMEGTRAAPTEGAEYMTASDICSSFRFLDLPIEIRLRIYEYLLHLHHPMRRRHPPSPNYNVVDRRDWKIASFISEPVEVPSSSTITNEGNDLTSEKRMKKKLLPQHRARGYIPQALLRTCRQVYHEARLVPFHQNEFVFATHWGTSGLTIASEFMKHMADWQRESMRFALLDLRDNKMIPTNIMYTPFARMSGTAATSWMEDRKEAGRLEDLCQSSGWAVGLQGLRVSVPVGALLRCFGPDRNHEHPHPHALEKCSDEDKDIDDEGRTDHEKGENDGFCWIDEGLARLRVLRWLEIEVEDLYKKLTAKQTVDMCAMLNQRLNAGMIGENGEWRPRERRVSVVCVKRVKTLSSVTFSQLPQQQELQQERQCSVV